MVVRIVCGQSNILINNLQPILSIFLFAAMADIANCSMTVTYIQHNGNHADSAIVRPFSFGHGFYLKYMRVPPAPCTQCTQCTGACVYGCTHEP